MTTSQQTQQQQSSTTPWAPQAAQLTNAFGDADTAFNTASGAVAPTQFTAGMTPDQLAEFQQMFTAGNGALPAGTSGIGSGSTAQTAGVNGATGALTALGGFNASDTNNTSNVLNTANQYVAGQNIPAEVKNAMQAATEEARDVTNPGTESAAAGNGNINGSRTGLAEGIVDRGLTEQAGNLSGTLQSNAFDQGANLGENMLSTNNTQNLGALSTALSGGTGLNTSGAASSSTGIDSLANLLGISLSGATGQQTANQLDLTNQLQQFQSATQSPYANVDELMQLIGGTNWGGSTTGSSTTTSTPSALSAIAGLMGAGGSLIGSKAGALGGGSGILGILSDRRFKTDISKIGQLDDGQPIYRFRYVDSPQFHVGLMAQDVEKTKPDAVYEIAGIKYVNYGEATKHLAA